MPCKQCDNESYRWGEKGECEYDSKEACEKANTKYKEMKTMPTPLGVKTYSEYAKELAEFNKANELKLNLSAEKIELTAKTRIEKAVKTLRDEVEKGQYFGDRGKDTLVILDKKRTLLKKDMEIVKKQMDASAKQFNKVQSLLGEVEKDLVELGLRPDDAPYYKAAVRDTNILNADYNFLVKNYEILKKGW
tara:strand:- start:368 stop:940 length:573 start_codon:yes stop_codon:yes gene_type:complete